MSLISLTMNVDRLAVVLETAIPLLQRIADAADRAFPPVRMYPPTPAGPEAYQRLTDQEWRQRRQERTRSALLESDAATSQARNVTSKPSTNAVSTSTPTR